MNKNLLGIDFEDWFHPELIKKYLKDEKFEPKVVNGIGKILELLRKNDTNATFFIVGELLEFEPEILDKILEKYQIKIDKFLDGKYLIEQSKDNKFELPNIANKIINGFNQNEVILVPKNLKNKGLFENFFQLFS